jgi:outer membrane immunogenic protein
MDPAMNLPVKISGLGRLAFAATVATAGLAAAPAQAGGPPPVPPVYSWTGFYVGLHGGWGWGRTEIQDELFNPIFNPTEVKYNGPLVGGQAGANWQQGNFVLGAEIDGSWAFVRGNSSRNQGVISSSTKNDFGYRSLTTGTARVGYAMGQWLVYAKGGGAYAVMDVTTQIAPDPVTYHSGLFGGTGGVGLEVAFLRNVSAKVEYNYIWLPTDHLQYVSQNTTSSLDHRIQVVKFGLNVRLDAGLLR